MSRTLAGAILIGLILAGYTLGRGSNQWDLRTAQQALINSETNLLSCRQENNNLLGELNAALQRQLDE